MFCDLLKWNQFQHQHKHRNLNLLFDLEELTILFFKLAVSLKTLKQCRKQFV